MTSPIVLAICVAYEQGFGHGAEERALKNPYSHGALDTYEAWEYGYQQGKEWRYGTTAEHRDQPVLAPCPFCGSKSAPRLQHEMQHHSGDMCRPAGCAVVCTSCGASCGYQDKSGDAAAEWNRRAVSEDAKQVYRRWIDLLEPCQFSYDHSNDGIIEVIGGLKELVSEQVTRP